MELMSTTGTNDSCPCGSGLKYNECCFGKHPWDEILSKPFSQQIRYLSLRGKNILFLTTILEALQIDTWRPDIDFASFKKAFTPAVVRKIHESLIQIWPDLDDYERCHAEDRKSVSGLYIGTYEPEAIFQAVTRHALYSEKIYLVDPFLHPARLRTQFSPLVHPEEHRVNTIKFSFLWLSLFPWIDAGIVNFIRPPTDFIPELKKITLDLNRKFYASSPELEALLEEETEERISAMSPSDRGFTEYYHLSFPDAWFLEEYKKRPPNDIFPTAEEFLKYIQSRRDSHPYFVENLPGQKSELLYETSGANYELAKRICSITGSHLITDFRTYWKQIELDREKAGVNSAEWTPFAKALQNSELKVLNNVSLEAALTLRKENRLEALRLFFRRVWKNCRDPEIFSETNAANLTAELDERIREAKSEWNKIDHDLVQWFGAPVAAISSAGLTGFLPAAPAIVGAAATGAVGLIQSALKRSSYKERFPAGFFLTIKK